MDAFPRQLTFDLRVREAGESIRLRYVPRSGGSRTSVTQEAVMADDDATGGNLRDRIARGGEDALGKLAQDLLENPLVTGAISRAFEARERAVAAQETAMSALNLPSAADLERLTRRLRSVSQRLEGIEDGVDRLDRRFEETAKVAAPPDDRLTAIEEQLSKLTAEVASLARALDA
jgi:hypothetical protein